MHWTARADRELGRGSQQSTDGRKKSGHRARYAVTISLALNVALI
jgi:hypothetical protein